MHADASCTLMLHARSFVCTLHARSCVLTLTLCLFTILAFKLHLLTLVYALFTYASCTLYCAINFTLIRLCTLRLLTLPTLTLRTLYFVLTFSFCDAYTSYVNAFTHTFTSRFARSLRLCDCVIACLLIHSQMQQQHRAIARCRTFL